MKINVNGSIVFAATGGRPFDPSRPAIVFIHGAGLDHTCWQLHSRWFAWHGWSSLAVDLPAHGHSSGAPLATIADMRDWIVAVLDAVGVEKAAMVGHSMGAVIALETAAGHPDRATGLALLGISSSIPVHPALLEAARTAPERAYDMMTAWCFANPAKLGGNPAPGIWMAGSARMLFDRGRDHALATDLAACNAWTGASDSAAKISVPTLFVLGEQDVMTPARKGQELAASISHATCMTIPGCGHMLMQERPDKSLDALIAHFGAR